MALRELSPALLRIASRDSPSLISRVSYNGRRHASTESKPAADPSIDFEDLESQTSLNAAADLKTKYDPVKRAKARGRQLPPSRYQFRPPRYYRGPLHPHQPPPVSDPSSREFVPGPFHAPRLEQTWKSTIAADYMTLTYLHKPPGFVAPVKAPRLREWDDSSPYHKGRPLRGPRGGDVLRMLEHDITFRNVPRIIGVTVHSFVKGAKDNSAYLHAAGLLLQAVTGVRPHVHFVKHNHARFGLREGTPMSLVSAIWGREAWSFFDKCINLVFPKIKDWPGIDATSGDESGNISFGFDAPEVALFPEVEVNYDMYPPKMIPGFHVTVITTARSDRHARLLLEALGVPFYGEFTD